jgi:hypothetical protein
LPHTLRIAYVTLGFKQAPCTWFHRSSFILSIGFSASKSYSSLFIFKHSSSLAYFLLFVGDIILIANTTMLLQSVIASLKHEFSVSGLGDIHHVLGINVNILFIS